MCKTIVFLIVLISSTLAQNETSAEFLIHLDFSLNNSTIPSYILNIVYNTASEHNITTSDLLSLFAINSTNITATQLVLEQLNVTESAVFSLDGLQYGLTLFNLTFRDFYNDFLEQHNLAGTTNLRDALIVLGIDVAQFSMGMQYGSPDPWEEFSKGNFSLEKWEEACSLLGISVEESWGTAKLLFIKQIQLIYDDVDEFLVLLELHHISLGEALVIWDQLKVDVDQGVFGDLLQSVWSKVANQTILGAVTGVNQAVIHRKVFETFSTDLEVLKVKASPIDSDDVYDVLTVNDTTYRDLVVLHLNSSAAKVVEISPNNTQQDLVDCTLVSVFNHSVVSYSVAQAIYSNHSYSIGGLVNDTVVSGSALICNNTLYGLVRGVEEGVVVVDGFAVYLSQPENGANFIGNKWALACNTIFTTLIVMVISH